MLPLDMCLCVAVTSLLKICLKPCQILFLESKFYTICLNFQMCQILIQNLFQTFPEMLHNFLFNFLYKHCCCCCCCGCCCSFSVQTSKFVVYLKWVMSMVILIVILGFLCSELLKRLSYYSGPPFCSHHVTGYPRFVTVP